MRVDPDNARIIAIEPVRLFRTWGPLIVGVSAGAPLAVVERWTKRKGKYDRSSDGA